MFLQVPQQGYLQRQTKTSEPRFKRLSRITSPESRLTIKHSFKNINKTYALDNSKENLFYETHLTKVRSACKMDEATIVSKYLGTIRKDFDDLNKLSRKEQSSMRLKRREIEFMRRKNQVFCQSLQELEQKIKQKEEQTNQVRSKEQDSKMQTKTLENIIIRMKKDQIFYKQFGRIRDEELKKKIKQVKLLEENLIHEEEKLHKLATNLQKCRELYDSNKEVRQKKFEDFSGKISDVRQRDRFIQERKERTYELQSIELNDTLDEKNIHMRQIILAHKVADSLLQSKVSTLIQKYSDIQGAFHLVRVRTGVTEPQLLTSKFFSYEQTSESLLTSIAQNQEYIQQLRKKKEILTEEHRQLMNQNLLLLDEGSPRKCSIDPAAKQKIIDQTNKNELIIEEINNWINRFTNELRPEGNQKESITQKFELLCETLRSQLKQNQNYNWADQKIPTTNVCLKKMVRQKSPQELSIRLRESQEMNESNLIEQQFIKASRQNIQKKSFNIKHFKRQSRPQ